MSRQPDPTRMMTILPLALVAALASPVQAQEAAGLIAGSIVDAETGSPLADAVVIIEPSEAGLLTAPRDPSRSVSLRRGVSDALGAYVFPDLPRGSYILRVERVGYRSARVHIDLHSGHGARLSLRLDVDPIPLERLIVPVDAPATRLSEVRHGTFEEGGHPSQALRERRYLEPDAHLVGGTDVATAHTFPEEDLLRAVQRLPGVSTRDEYSAELWTRGASWGLTRVYLDDLPLLDPFFAAGTLTALAPSAVGGVFLHSGARPVSIGEGAAGVATISTRDASGLTGLPTALEVGSWNGAGHPGKAIPGRARRLDGLGQAKLVRPGLEHLRR